MGKLTMKLVFTALAVAVIGVSFVATAGTASADGPRGDDKGCWYERGDCKDGRDDDHKDRDKHDRHDDKDKHDVCYKCNDRDFERKKHDFDSNKDNVRVKIVFAIIFASPVPTGYVDFTPYSQGVALLVQHSAWVIGVDTYTLFVRLSNGESLLTIANSYGIGQAALIEGLLFYNPDLRPFTDTIIHKGWLLTSNMYIPL